MDFHSEKLKCAGNGWDAFFHPSGGSLLDFSVSGNKLLSVQGITATGFSEPAGQYPRVRHHRYSSVPGGLVEMDSAPQPSLQGSTIRRSIEYHRNRIRFVTDLAFNRTSSPAEVCIDNVKIAAKCLQIGTLTANDSGEPKRIEWMDIDGDGIILPMSRPPLAWLFKLESGGVLEIGTGDDLWRWDIGTRLGLQPEFAVVKQGACLMLSRKVINTVPPESSVARKFRFTWYLAWDDGRGKENSLSEGLRDAATVFNLADFEWPLPAKVESAGGQVIEYPCFHSDFVWNIMKKRVRENLENPDKDIVFKNVRPMTCLAARHLDRASKGTLAHGNLVSLMNFSLWAERQMAGKSSGIFFLPSEDDPVYGQLPSFRGLSKN